MGAVLAGWLLARRRIGFAAQRPAFYAETAPVFDLRRHLSGTFQSEGVIYGPLGRVDSRFVARMQGDWQGDQGTLRESFRFASGATQTRAWQLRLTDGNRFTATADDVVGTAHGEQSGAALRLIYRLRLPADAGGHVLSVVDWLYLTENGSIVNRSEMRKFGIKVAELVATMRPLAPTDADSPQPVLSD
ncbi:DUF3833 domain-containing protein [Sedimentitalea sp. HM32M-2]|uniref:DUF3833 domain-containing protein n=1 Tax=Sedimentitalea sp. HM32M-2 TaxID=3351566 RepID=UPI0036260D6B